jgi:hypothetical protein
MELSPFRKDVHARSIPTMLPEQAVSMCILGPSRLKYQLTRFASIARAVPVIAVRGFVSGSM